MGGIKKLAVAVGLVATTALSSQAQVFDGQEAIDQFNNDHPDTLSQCFAGAIGLEKAKLDHVHYNNSMGRISIVETSGTSDDYIHYKELAGNVKDGQLQFISSEHESLPQSNTMRNGSFAMLVGSLSQNGNDLSTTFAGQTDGTLGVEKQHDVEKIAKETAQCAGIEIKGGFSYDPLK